MAFDKILVVDDELIIRKSLETQLRKKRYVVASVASLQEASSYLAKDQFDLIFLDMRLPDGQGIDLLAKLSQQNHPPMVIMVTGHGSIESAVECIRAGAFDYILKPCSMEQIEMVLKKAEDYNQLLKVNRYFNDQLVDGSDLVGKSLPMLHLKQMVQKVAATEATVLITGENGTGKEVVAREIYRLSRLNGKPYVRVNCAAIPENLIESEFFGHEKGSFTGANERRDGRFELAHEGTILLDEIGEVALSVQTKLLRVLQEQEFERVGGSKTIKVNVRVMATTNRDLQKAVQAGQFREDLFYRLNVFPIVVPPLRDRKGDVELLAEAFLERQSRRSGLHFKGFTSAALAAFKAHNWPGNVRELHNAIERAVILATPDQAIDVADLCLGATRGSNSFKPLDLLEREHIESALQATQGEVPSAASLLNIPVRLLRSKITQHGIIIVK